MRKILPVAVIFVFFAVSTFAQSNEQNKCPSIAVIGPSDIVQPGESAGYTAAVKPDEKRTGIDYKWTVSLGKILAGQGTDTIQVQQPEEGLTVMVEVAGLPGGCPNRASVSIDVIWAPPPIMLDEFIGPLSKISDSRFKAINEILQENVNDALYLFIEYAPGTTEKSKRSIRTNLVERLNMSGRDDSAPRMVFVDVGSRRRRITIWQVAPGSAPPKAN